jgi:hypothetical protein
MTLPEGIGSFRGFRENGLTFWALLLLQATVLTKKKPLINLRTVRRRNNEQHQ